MVRRRTSRFLGIAIVAASVLGGGGVATAATPDVDIIPYGACNEGVGSIQRIVTGSSHRWVAYSNRFHAINDGSTPMSATFSATSGGSRGASLSGTVEGGISAAVATAKASVSSGITRTVSWSTSLSVGVSVPAHKTTYAEFGSDTYSVRITTRKLLANCVWQTQGTGTLTAPTSVGWKRWNS